MYSCLVKRMHISMCDMRNMTSCLARMGISRSPGNERVHECDTFEIEQKTIERTGEQEGWKLDVMVERRVIGRTLSEG